MPVVVANYIKRHIRLLDDKFLVLAADDIRRHLEDYAEHEPNPNLWQGLLGALETEQDVYKRQHLHRLAIFLFVKLHGYIECIQKFFSGSRFVKQLSLIHI